MRLRVFGGIVGKMKDTLADQKNEPDAPVEQRFTTPLKPLFEQFHVPTTIDYMSLDVEGAERYSKCKPCRYTNLRSQRCNTIF